MKKESLDDELNNLSPWLRQRKQEGDGFRVPPDYFETLEDKIFARLEASDVIRKPMPMQVLSRNNRLNLQSRTAMAIAATLVLALAAVWFFRSLPTPASMDTMASVELTDEDIEAYVLDNLHEFETDQLASLPGEEQPETSEQTEPKSTKSKPSLDDLSPDDVDRLLDDMTDEELEQLL